MDIRLEKCLIPLSYSDQKIIIESSIRASVKLYVLPLFFSSSRIQTTVFGQNEDTFNILDSFGIIYNSGFIEGVKYMPGHEKDASPYLLDGHRFSRSPYKFCNKFPLS